MQTAREKLNELKWRPGKGLDSVEISYVHRGAPGDRKVITGNEITELSQLFFHTEDATIPYHRIRTIKDENGIVWERKPQTGE